MDDKELIKRVIEQKDKKALEILTKKYQNLIYSIALKYYAKQDKKMGLLTVDDLFQELYIIFLQSLANYKGDSKANFITYLYKCLTLSCHKIHKKNNGLINIPVELQDAIFHLKKVYEENEGATLEEAQELLKDKYFAKRKTVLKTANAILDISVVSCNIKTGGEEDNEIIDTISGTDDDFVKIETEFDLDIITSDLTEEEKGIFNNWLETGTLSVKNAKKLASEINCKNGSLGSRVERFKKHLKKLYN